MTVTDGHVWHSADGRSHVEVTWRHDGAQVVVQHRDDDQAQATWNLAFDDDDLWTPDSAGRRIVAADGIHPRRISEQYHESVGLDVGKPVEVGGFNPPEHKRHAALITLEDPEVARHHCLIFRQPDRAHYCLVNLRNETLVNQRPVYGCLLYNGDLIQIGPFAFVFSSQLKSQRGFLLPVKGIDGVGIELCDVALDKLGPVNLHVAPGEMVAVIGPSGSGKSTLVRAITAIAGPPQGSVTCEGRDTREESAWFRGRLGYVSQADVVPSDLTTWQGVKFSAELREVQVSDNENELKSVLLQVEIPEDHWKKVPGKLSGGQRKRVRIAAELIAAPRLLIMDEPASGLDRNRETSLLRLLRTLRHRGCTILVVTHNLRTLNWFDRVYVIRNGVVGFEGKPDELRRSIPSGKLGDLDLDAKLPVHGTLHTSPLTENARQSRHAHRSHNWRRQAGILLRREWSYLWNARFKRLVLPLAIVPAVFAAAIGAAVRPEDRSLLGFLAILACIWMSASLSLMAIVDEREVYEHERLLFLRNESYVLSKTGIYWALSGVQTCVFAVILLLCRWLGFGAQSFLFHAWWSVLVIAVVGWSATGVGLLISALANHSKSAAALLLPLFMMAQIVLSVLVGAPRAAMNATDVEEVYLNYSWNAGPNVQRASGIARTASYLTLTRYADRALRSFAYHEDAHEPTSATSATSARSKVVPVSIAILLIASLLTVAATWGCLCAQNHWETTKRWLQCRWQSSKRQIS